MYAFVFQFSIRIVVEDFWEECLRIQVAMVLLIRLHKLCCTEVGEQNLRFYCLSRDLKTEMMKGSSGSLRLAIVEYPSQV